MAIVRDLSGNSPVGDQNADPSYLNLLSNFDGPGAGPEKRWPGGRGTLSISGTFGGTTARLQYKGANDAWFDVDTTNASFAAAGMCGFELAPGLIRINTAAGTPSAMYAVVRQVRRTGG